MDIKDFDILFCNARSKTDKIKTPRRIVVASAESVQVLEPVIKAYLKGIIEPILVGDRVNIRMLLKELEADNYNFRTIPTRSKEESAQKSIDIINAGDGDILMKGLIETSTILKALFKKENDMCVSKLASCITICEVEGYHKLLCLADAAINMYPNYIQKKHIIENSVNVMQKLGWSCPKVAALAAIETVNLKMPETVDAELLKQMNQRGEIDNCIIEGPISIDIALKVEAARTKGFNSPVAGDADLLLYPNITAANIGSKTFGISGKNRRATLITGFKMPFILTSRGTSADEKLRSMLLATILD